MKKQTQISRLIKKFSHYLLIGLSALVLLAVGQTSQLFSMSQSGPAPVLAQSAGNCGASDRVVYSGGQRVGFCSGEWIQDNTSCSGNSENPYYYTSCELDATAPAPTPAPAPGGSDPNHCAASDGFRYSGGQRTSVSCTGYTSSNDHLCSGDSVHPYWYASCGATTITPPPSGCGTQVFNEGCVRTGVRRERVYESCSGQSSTREVSDSSCVVSSPTCSQQTDINQCVTTNQRRQRIVEVCDGAINRVISDQTFADASCGTTGITPITGVGGPGGQNTNVNSSNNNNNSNANSNANSNSNVSNNSNVNTVTVNQSAPQVIREREVVREIRLATADAVCPAGFTRRVEGNVVVCVAPAPTAGAQPQAVTVVQAAGAEVKELPKTGLPVLVWTAASLIPLGMRMRKFGHTVSANYHHPNYLWEERRFKRG